MDLGVIRLLYEQARATGSRSTALHPIQWLLGLSLTATVSAASFGSPSWLVIALFVLSGISVTLFIGAYLFLLFRDRDALRSERYGLQKMVIEKGLLGDDMSGIMDVAQDAEVLPAIKRNEEKKE